MSSKGDELVKYITERVVDYVETPRDVRRERSRGRQSWSQTWFGMIPFSISLWVRQIPFHRIHVKGKELPQKEYRIKGRDPTSRNV
ncbi:YqzE family protein [Paenibacillus lutimineralis]|uniref:YqzE family protein n=1 Tax=Paenibacillus lutimineralis TaxID=2707005 RepID=A0A3S9V169_9BACL|nr:YqzE family protein [Paenibacillus lutimineralis]AZS16256.1 YqzE family protein [Paenibacillus lutimineralis]